MAAAVLILAAAVLIGLGILRLVQYAGRGYLGIVMGALFLAFCVNAAVFLLIGGLIHAFAS